MKTRLSILLVAASTVAMILARASWDSGFHQWHP